MKKTKVIVTNDLVLRKPSGLDLKYQIHDKTNRWGAKEINIILTDQAFKIHHSMKGCVASDDFILEVWKRKFESKNPNITITEGLVGLERC